MATHPFGCNVIQRVMEKCTDQQIQQVWIELMKSAGQLMQVRNVFFNMAWFTYIYIIYLLVNDLNRLIGASFLLSHILTHT